jgi:aspartyl-tRNA(Asn)/glutamyl-tRNA(Gln) amidotransferase subunit A
MAVTAGSICDLDLGDVSEALAARRISSVEATEAYLERIARHDGVLQAYITVMRDAALSRARAADAEQSRGSRRGPLHGVPLALKDLVAVAGVRMTGGSEVLADHVPMRDAFVTERLHAAGAVVLGKLSMHEWAFGRPTREGRFPTGRNPWDVARIPAGSSSGSGVAVAAGLCAGALGSDTGGSIRGPASMCGIVGHKPTYGLVSRGGVLAMDWSLDHVGPMTRSVWDSAAILQAIAGHDPADPGSLHGPVPDFMAGLERGARGIRLGLLRRYYVDWPGLDGEVKPPRSRPSRCSRVRAPRSRTWMRPRSTWPPRCGHASSPRCTSTIARRPRARPRSFKKARGSGSTWARSSPPRTSSAPSACARAFAGRSTGSSRAATP